MIKQVGNSPTVLNVKATIKRRAAGADKDEILSSPQIVTLPGRPATIEVAQPPGPDGKPGERLVIELDIKTLSEEDGRHPEPGPEKHP